MKDSVSLIGISLLCGFILGTILSSLIINTSQMRAQSGQPTPQPFELRTIQVQQGKALITLCIDKRTEQAVPCTAFYTLP